MPRYTVSLKKNYTRAATRLPLPFPSFLYSATFRNGSRFVKHRKKTHDLNETNAVFAKNPNRVTIHQLIKHHQKKVGLCHPTLPNRVVINSKFYSPLRANFSPFVTYHFAQ